MIVSIIIPCRNEEKFINKCLDSIIANNYPKDRLEILVVDGMSEDKTRSIVKNYTDQHSFIKLLDNSKKITPYALNIGIKNSRGEVVVRIDAHNIYEKNYISKCVKYLQEYDVDNVGGTCVTLPGNDTLVSKSIALTLSHSFGVGNAYFRIGLKESKLVDTVPFGCYKKEVFDRVGLFNENLVRNQDIEFNLRLKNSGGKILLAPNIVSYYHARSTLRALAKNNFWNGFWIIYSNKFVKLPFSIRHLVPFIFVLSLLGSLLGSVILKPFLYVFILIGSSYLVTNAFVSFKLSLQKGIKYFIPLTVSFATLHFSYGLGSMWGMIKLVFFYKKCVTIANNL